MDRLDRLTNSASQVNIPGSRRAAGRMAFLQTFRNLFTAGNPIRQFQNAYRFNIIRWSASNLRTPPLSKRIGLFFQTRNPLSILRNDYRMNRNRLVNNWEVSTINDINRRLTGIGRTSLDTKDRGTFKTLNAIEKKIKGLEGYERCPDMEHERILLDTYRYILSSPFAPKFGKLVPDDICEMLQQNGLSASNLPYQNYEGILQGRETVMYELATRQNGSLYLFPADHAKLNPAPEGVSMELISRFPQREMPTVPDTPGTIQMSEKIKKTDVPKEPKKQQHSRKGKTKSVKIK